MFQQNKLSRLLYALWSDFCVLNPQAQFIKNSLESPGEQVINDHLALRTFSLPEISAEALAAKWLPYGYEIEGEYAFNSKNLTALHLRHFDVGMPKIFISQFIVQSASVGLQKIITRALAQLGPDKIAQESLLYSGRGWQASFTDYRDLCDESEYAAWVYAHGFRANHFTVFINKLKKMNDIRDLNRFLKDRKHQLNTSGGEVKGSPAALLEQSSTQAVLVPVRFSDGVYEIPGGYYEFAKRYPARDGKLFQGFVTESADRIFESTYSG